MKDEEYDKQTKWWEVADSDETKKCLGEFLDPIYAQAKKKYEDRKNYRANTGDQEFKKDERKKLGLKKHKGSGGVGPGY